MSKQLPVEDVFGSNHGVDFIQEVATFAGIQEVPTGSHHKFNRVSGSCECTVCGQGEAFAAHLPPVPRRPNLKEMHASWQQAKREAEEVTDREIDIALIKRERNGRKRKVRGVE
jgi:hypothetical protein